MITSKQELEDILALLVHNVSTDDFLHWKANITFGETVNFTESESFKYISNRISKILDERKIKTERQVDVSHILDVPVMC